MLSEIGSNFWLDPHQEYPQRVLESPRQFGCHGIDYVWLSTGRSAIQFVIQAIEREHPDLKKVAVLPSFTCDTVFEPFLKAGYEVCYYPVKTDLTASTEDILQVAMEKETSIVLFHRYFGFDTLKGSVDKMCEVLREQGKYSIEDCTQCLYSDISRADADFTIGSIRKWTGTPDGGFAVCRCGQFQEKPVHPDEVLEQAKVKASYAKYRYLFEQEGSKDKMLEMYREAEEILDHQETLYTISEMSAWVQANLDKDGLMQNRRRNYQFLEEHLAGIVNPVFSLSSNSEVPLYFPILVDNRASLQKYLIDNAVYAPIVWPKSDQQPSQCIGAENAYRHLLCIPIDQRYGGEEMMRVVSIIKDFFGK